ncbi:hypothetical protein OAX78_01325, partial [Planctomycetota bacterium]|nr:hypothetical protein [Planctomycetota bacterium]
MSSEDARPAKKKIAKKKTARKKIAKRGKRKKQPDLEDSDDGFRECRYCAEEIPSDAKKCPECGERVTAGKVEVALARWEGDAVGFRKGFKMAKGRCCVCA